MSTLHSIWIKDPLAIYSNSQAAASMAGGIVIRDGIITELLPSGGKPSVATEQIYNASKHVVLPGLINTHHHFYQTQTRAFPDALDKPLFPWLKSLYPIWANLQAEQVYWSSRLALAELLLSGCTTAADHHYLFPKGLEHAVDLQVEAANDLGMRMTITRGSMSLGEDEGGLPPRTTIQTEQVIMDDSERVIAGYHDASEGSMLQIALAPCSPFSVTTAIMEASAKLAQAHDVRLHTHLAETHDETDFCLAKFGLRPVDYLENVGWLNNKTWLAHGIHFSTEEIQRLGQNQVGVSHCPTSNMMLASGSCPALALQAAGSPLGIGVDGSASNDGSNMIQELRMAMYLQRLQSGAENVSHLDALHWGTQGSARCLGRDDIGDIDVGKQADIAMFSLNEARFSGHGDPLAALLLCGAHQADRVMIKGQWRVVNGAIIDLDLDELIAKHHQSAQVLAQRFYV